ncbi:unnamed protein product [Ascophyllum nodosum]
MSIAKEVLGRCVAETDSNLCRDKAVALLREGKASAATEWFGKALAMRPADASLYLARSRARERAGNAREAVLDAAVGVCLRPRVAAGFVRLSAAFEAQGRHASAVRICFLGMRCGDTSKNGELSARMGRAREAGQLPPLDWKPPDRRERWAWAFLSFRGFLLRVAVGIAGRLLQGRLPALTVSRVCGGLDGFMKAPWPRGAMPPALLQP